MRVQSLGQEDPIEKRMAIHSSVLTWKIHGQRSLMGYSSWGHKESVKTEQACTKTNGMEFKVSLINAFSFFKLVNIFMAALGLHGCSVFL